jgi:hypothetical protein
VEVVGSFTETPWATRLPMTLPGAEWSVEVPIPWDQSAYYQFVIDGTIWIADPVNPEQVDDGFGGQKSVLAPATCDPWTCADPPASPVPRSRSRPDPR